MVVLMRNPFQPSQREVMVAHPSQTIRQWLGTQGIAEFERSLAVLQVASLAPELDEALGRIVHTVKNFTAA